MVFAGAASAGALLAVLIGARDRLRGRGRVVAFGLLVAGLVAGGILLTRPEARAVVAVFATVPLVAGFVLASVDLRRGRR